jgi:L-alanine-DL-glutamate epimerase-like enolase superfamily enzyme
VDAADSRPLIVRPVACGLFLSPARTRVPFRFGATTLESGTICTARVEIDSEHGRSIGYSADLLVPGWFRKDSGRTPERDVRELIESAKSAGRVLLDSKVEDTVFEHWLRMWVERVEASGEDARGDLERGFGVALIERALIDAACRAAGCSFFGALERDLLGSGPLAVERPTAIAVRHTIGMLDALDASDAHAPSDGLPRSLDEEIARYGLRCFKIKLRGDVGADRARVLAIARSLRNQVAEPLVTLDGNEQFESLDDLAHLLHSLQHDGDGAWLAEHLAYIEQPLPRALTFDRAAHAGIERVHEFAPLIIDEADATLRSFERAFELGYRGVSVKNCKGVFRALLHRGQCEAWGDGAFQSGEDLTNLGVLSLQQDLATMAALGMTHVERNGHHYFRGLAHLAKEEVADALEHHADLYEPLGDGATLRIRNGQIALGSLDCVGYGYDVRIRTEQRERVS